MIRILHLHGREPGFQNTRASDSLRRTLGAGFSVDARAFTRGGTDRNLLAAVRMLRLHDATVVHAWDDRALTAAALASRGRILYSPGEWPSRASIGWLRAVMSYRDVHVTCYSATLQRVLVERGVPISHCHLVRPGAEFGRIKRRRDPALRAALGLAEQDHVLLAVGESTRAASHADAVWGTSMLHILDPHQKLLVWGRGPEAHRLADFAAKVGQPNLLHVAEARLRRKVELEELLPAADGALVTATGPVPTLPIAICMAAALPIVSTVTYTVAELLEDRHTALMTAPSKPRQLAQRILDLKADSQLQWSISDMARTEAYEYFSHTRFVSQYRAIYEQLAAGSAVDVPRAAPGPGLRFHASTPG